MTPIEWILLGSAVANIIIGVMLKMKTGQAKDVATGLAVLEAVIDENKLAEHGNVGKQITGTIAALGPIAVQAVTLARQIKAGLLKAKELDIIRREDIERAAEIAARNAK